MKNFLTYLTESQKTYEFRIKIANIDVSDKMDRLESVLEAYSLDSISKPKRLPIKESDIDFPSMKNCELYIMDAVLKYPVNDAQLRSIIAERAGIPQANIIVVPKNHPEEIWRWNVDDQSELREYVQGESVIDKPYEENPEAKKAGDAYQKFSFLVKELSEPKAKVEGSDTTIGGEKNPAHSKTLNEVPQGDASPVGSKQNNIPSPV